MSNVTAQQLRRNVRARTYRSVVNQAHFHQATVGERLADRIASGIGSWTFLIVQTVLVLLWSGSTSSASSRSAGTPTLSSS